jgi:HAD superfamily hydrolase (TIGR01509 family)
VTIRAVCFDLDATLVDYNAKAYAEIVSRVCATIAAEQPGIDAEVLAQRHGAISPEVWRAWGEALDPRPDLDRSGITLMRSAWQQALAACGCDDRTLVARAFDLYWNESRVLFTPFDDAVPLLEALHGRYKLAVITNGPADTQLDKLETAGLARYFDLFVASGGVGYAKPHHEIFRHALEGLNVEAKDACHIGDYLPNDVAGAHASGLTAVWLNRHGLKREATDPEPHHEIASLQELTALLP